MSRYIDADKVIQILNGSMCTFPDCYVAENIEQLPTIDIVRCGECRWWLKNLTEDDEDEAYLHCPIEDGSADDFCSYGERENDAD